MAQNEIVEVWMAQNEIVEVSAASNDRKTNRRVLVASLSIQKVRLNIYQDAGSANTAVSQA
ncbi:hypothetical protein ACXGSF_06510 [Limosilactobacillus mucosae]